MRFLLHPTRALRRHGFAGAVLLAPSMAFGAVLLGSPARLPVDGAPLAVVAADIDADGDLDVVTANESGGDGPSLSVLLGFGDGSFAPEERLNLDPRRYLVQALAAADFDGDDQVDLGVAVDDISTFPPQAAVLLYKRTGTRQFGRPVRLPIDGLAPRCLVAADADGDEHIDLLACVARASDGSGAIARLRGNGAGEFVAATTLAAGFVPSAVEVVDLDRDGRVDLVVTDAAEPQVHVLYGNQAGFDAAQHLPVGAIASAVRVVRDSDLPRLAVASANSREIEVLSQRQPRDFQSTGVSRVDDAPVAAIAADIDGDGADELVAVSHEPARIAVYEVSADGCVRRQRLTAANLPIQLATADFNADGRVDIAVAALGADAAEVYLNGISPVATPTATSAAGNTATVPTPTPTGASQATATVPAAPSATVKATATPTRPPGASATPTSVVALPTATATSTPAPQPGDANCDGRIDSADVSELVWQMFRPYCAGADVNGDGMMSAADIILLMELLEPAP